MAKRGFKIMDSDLHVTEPGDLWENYMEWRFKDQAPRFKPVAGPGSEAWQFANRLFPAYSDHPDRVRSGRIRREKAIARHLRIGRYSKPEQDLAGDDPRAMLRAMDREGIDVCVAFRTLASHLIAVDGLDPQLSAAVCRAFNNWLADYCNVNPTRLKLAAVMPLHNPQFAAEEARRSVGELGAVALVFPSQPVNGLAWYDRSYDPVWAEAERLQVPVAFHGIHMAYQEHISRRYIGNFALAHAAAHPIELMLALGCLLTAGVFERFQGLKAAFLEGSCSWLPWWLWCLDERVEKFGDDDRYPLKLPPSECFKRHCFVSVEPTEAVIKHAINAIGDNNIVISTDWPHDDSAYPHAIDSFLALDGLNDENRRKILWDNCCRLYNLS
jgi:uncharacterized protein